VSKSRNDGRNDDDHGNDDQFNSSGTELTRPEFMDDTASRQEPRMQGCSRPIWGPVTTMTDHIILQMLLKTMAFLIC
jgi:hypothetical protein